MRDVPTTPFNFLLANQDMSLQTGPPNKKARYFSIGLVFQSDQNKFPENCPPLRADGVYHKIPKKIDVDFELVDL